MATIFKGNSHPNYMHKGGTRGVIANVSMRRWGAPPNFVVDPVARPLYAWVCRSSWVVTCDAPGCKEQIVVEQGDKSFFCPSCLNAAQGGKARPVIWPNDGTVLNVERVLRARADPNTRNFIPNEAVAMLVYGYPFSERLADLVLENKAHREPDSDEPLEEAHPVSETTKIKKKRAKRA